MALTGRNTIGLVTLALLGATVVQISARIQRTLPMSESEPLLNLDGEGVDAWDRTVLVLDGAGRHTSPDLVLLAVTDLVPLPPASLQLQLAEWL